MADISSCINSYERDKRYILVAYTVHDVLLKITNRAVLILCRTDVRYMKISYILFMVLLCVLKQNLCSVDAPILGGSDQTEMRVFQ